MEQKIVNVDLVRLSMACVGDDPGLELEIYGWLDMYKEGEPTKDKCWKVSKPVDVGYNKPVNINKTKQLKINSNEKLVIGGHLYEEDSFSCDDDLSEQLVQLLFNQIDTQDKNILFSDNYNSHINRDNPQMVRAEFKITSIELPTGGSECEFNAKDWDNIDFINTNNCYAYAVLQLSANDPKSHKKIQPGELSGKEFTKFEEKDIIDAVRRDLKMLYNCDIYKTTKFEIPPHGYRKVALVTGENQMGIKDYHWYMQNTNGWSHKPGISKVTRRDFSNEIIVDPEICNRKNPDSGVDFYNFCGFYMINNI